MSYISVTIVLLLLLTATAVDLGRRTVQDLAAWEVSLANDVATPARGCGGDGALVRALLSDANAAARASRRCEL